MTPAAAQNGVEVFFKPGQDVQAVIVAELGKAERSICVQAYRFTSPEIMAALESAQKRGVKVAVILDKAACGDEMSDAALLIRRDIAVFMDPMHAKAHNKIILIDGKAVITGSYNFSSAAAEGRNSENLIVMRDLGDIVRAYQQNYDGCLRHSEAYVVPPKR